MSKKNSTVTLQNFFIELPRSAKIISVLAADAVLIIFATWLSFCLRTDSWSMPKASQYVAYYLPLIFALTIFKILGIYRAIFRYSGKHTLISVAKACTLYGLMLLIFLNLFSDSGEIPRSIAVIQPILVFFLISGSRIAARFLLSQVYRNIFSYQNRPNVLIYGAGQSGRQAAYSIRAAETMTVLGFIDDNKTLQGGVIDGLEVYSVEQLSRLKEVAGVSDVLLALPSTQKSRRSEILNQLSQSHVHVRSLPNIADFADGKLQLGDLREVDLDDLLGRDIALECNSSDELHQNKTILVSGAGGSIGSELCRQISLLNPKKLVLLDHSEFNLYAVEQSLANFIRKKNIKIDLCAKLASVLDKRLVSNIVKSEKVQIIYHAAAYKHVPLVESNVPISIKNNVWGTLNLAESAIEFGVEKFILVSTDKSVRPTNIMGASKRIAEMILQSLAHRGSATCFSMVRFGNVLGSSGSVIPLFRKQIEEGGPITLTHPEVTRYFMTIPEAAQLVLQAARMSLGGEVFILDMGSPVKIINLAKKMIDLSGFTVKDSDHPYGDIEIKVTGLRPGEKLYEELLIGDNPLMTDHPRIMKANENFLAWGDLKASIDQLNGLIEENNAEGIKTLLEKMGIGYTPYQVQGVN